MAIDTRVAGKRGLILGGKVVETGQTRDVKNPYNGETVATVAQAGPEEVEAAIQAAVRGFEATRRLPAWKRSAILERVSQLIDERKEELARQLAQECGKPIVDARVEVTRAVGTFKIAAEEAKRIGGEVLTMDALPIGENKLGIVKRFPLGPITGISPFNFPLNLVAHKVAPALAAGNSIVIKPASATPLSALSLGELVMEAGAPEGAISVLPANARVVEPLVTDPRMKMLTFTGSGAVGWELKRQAYKKRVTLELGGNGAVIVHDDADIAHAAKRCAVAGFVYAGQVCISVQRIFVQRNVYPAFVEQLVANVKQLKTGDPLDESTQVGPMIDADAAARFEEWVQEAAAQGARIECGGTREGAVFAPTVLTNVRPEMKIMCLEAFAPMVGVAPYDTFEEAIRLVNESDYGLQAGVFTRDINRAVCAFNEVEVGGLMINEVGMYRADHMPYGGVKESGFGREGLKYAIEEMTEPRLMVIHL